MQLIEYWPAAVGIVSTIAAAAVAGVKFFKMQKDEQKRKIKEVLLAWVVDAEKTLGGGTGQIKLRYVYDLFISRFPDIAKVVKFETFSLWVDEALERMEEMLKENEALRNHVKSKK